MSLIDGYKRTEFVCDCASALLQKRSVLELIKYINGHANLFKNWKETDINGEFGWKKFLFTYFSSVDMEKVESIKKKYNLEQYRNISINELSIVIKMPKKELLRFKNGSRLEEKIFTELKKQNKNILLCQSIIIHKTNDWCGGGGVVFDDIFE